MDLTEARRVASAFEMDGEVASAAPYGSGHINDTYAVVVATRTGSRRYIFQRINHRIFRRVDLLMDNIGRVTQHLRRKLENTPHGRPDRETLTVIPTRSGASHLRTDAGDFWRAYLFIEGATTYDVLSDNRQAYAAARAYARFQGLLSDMPPPPLHETIPGFHDTPARFAALKRAVAADVAGRLRDCRTEVDFALSLESSTGRIVEPLAAGEIPLRVTHNDTKLNNVLLDDETGEGVCVIDLDTVMPGSVLYDFGDQVRSMVGGFMENERDLAKVDVKLDRFEHLVKGYLEVAGGFLNAREIDLLPLAGLLMTYEVGIRFLADYLQGDVYFKVHRPGENLDRARTQLALVRRIQDHDAAMTAIVEKYRRT